MKIECDMKMTRAIFVDEALRFARASFGSKRRATDDEIARIATYIAGFTLGRAAVTVNMYSYTSDCSTAMHMLALQLTDDQQPVATEPS